MIYIIAIVLGLLFLCIGIYTRRYTLITTDKDIDLNIYNETIINISTVYIEELKSGDNDFHNEEEFNIVFIDTIVNRTLDILLMEDIDMNISDENIYNHVTEVISYIDTCELYVDIFKLDRYKGEVCGELSAMELLPNNAITDNSKMDITSELNSIFFSDV